MQINKMVFIFFSILFFNACATTYKGNGPKLNLSTKEAKQEEIEKYEIKQTFLGGGENVEMDGYHYTLSSLQPIINQISPIAHTKIESGQQIRFISMGLLFAGLITYSLSDSNSSRMNDPMKVTGGLLMGSGFGGLIWGQHKVQAGIDQYNFDLRQKMNGSNSTSTSQKSLLESSNFGLKYSYSF